MQQNNATKTENFMYNVIIYSNTHNIAISSYYCKRGIDPDLVPWFHVEKLLGNKYKSALR